MNELEKLLERLKAEENKVMEQLNDWSISCASDYRYEHVVNAYNAYENRLNNIRKLIIKCIKELRKIENENTN